MLFQMCSSVLEAEILFYEWIFVIVATSSLSSNAISNHPVLQ